MNRVFVVAMSSLMLTGAALACSEKKADAPAFPGSSAAAPAPAAPTAPPPDEPPVPPRVIEPAPGAGAALVPPCGDEDQGQPACPLDAWMEEHMLKATEDEDLPAMARTLHSIEFLAPDAGWNQGEDGWAQIARRGAVAAEAGDLRGAKAVCKNCHKRWRDDFRANEDFRRRPVPALPANAEQGMPNLPQ